MGDAFFYACASFFSGESRRRFVIPGATDSVYIMSIEGVYRLALFTPATSACPMYSNIIIVNKTSNDCLSIKTPTANNDVCSTAAGIPLSGNVMDNDYTSDTEIVPYSALFCRYTLSAKKRQRSINLNF